MRAVVARLRRARSLPPGVVAAEIAWRAARGGLRSATLLRDRSSERVLATGGKPWVPFLSQGWSPPSAESLPPGALEACLREADAAIAGRFHVLGHGLLDFGRPPSWHSDPVTGASWRSDARGRRAMVTASSGADIKVPWEASRMHWLVALARAGRYTGDPGYARAAAGLLECWRRDNPIGRGVNWCNAMEVGIRAVNLVWASEILQDRSVDRLVGAMLPGHGRQILGNLEYSPRLTSNHYLADVVGLLYAGAALRRTLTGRAWLRFAAGALGREVCKQFDEDGVNFEASIGYHRLSTELVLFGVLAMDRLGLRPPPAAGARLGRAIEVLASLREPDGLLPAVGDDDSGLVVNLASERHPRDPAPLIGTGRALLAGSASQCAGGEFQQWAVGGAAAAPPPRAPVVALPRSGRFVLANRAIWCLVECGGVGQRGNGGHAHNDTLSFVLAVRGCELVTDPGSGTYTRDPVLRDRFRGTRAHATVEIDGQEINPIERGAPFRLQGLDRPVVEQVDLDGTPQRVRAGHRGYQRLPDPVLHRRGFELWPDRLLVADEIRCRGEHLAVVTFPLAPGTVAERRAGGWLLRVGSVETALRQVDGPEIRLAPVDSQVSPAYGAIRPSTSLRGQVVVRGPTRWQFQFVPIEPRRRR